MKPLLIILLFLPLTFVSQQFEWANVIKTDSLGKSVYAGDVLFDNFGNVIVSGRFDASTDFSTAGPSNTLLPAPGISNIYFAKYDSIGNLIWANLIDSCRAEVLFVNDSNNIIIHVDNYYSQSPFNFPQFVDVDFSNAVYDVSMNHAIVCYDENGNLLWVRESNQFNKIFKSFQGKILAVSHPVNQDTLIYETELGSDTIVLSGGNQPVAVILNYDGQGNYLNSFQYNPIQNGVGADIEIVDIITDSIGNSYFTGTFKVAIDFDLTGGGNLITADELNSIFVAKYDSSFNFIWIRQFDNTITPSAIKIAGTNNVLLIGKYDFSLLLPDSNWMYAITNNSYTNDYFIIRMDSSGNYVNSISLDAQNTYPDMDVEGNKNGEIYVCFSSSKGTDLNPNGVPYVLGNNYSYPIFVSKYDTNFDMLFAFDLGEDVASSTHGVQRGLSLHGDEVVIFGTISGYGSINFDPVDSSYVYNMGPANHQSFVVTYEGSVAILNSISELENGQKLSLAYPNPTIEKLKIEIFDNAFVYYKIFDIQGKLELSGKYYEGDYIDVRDLSSNYYILKIFDENNRSLGTAKFVKEN